MKFDKLTKMKFVNCTVLADEVFKWLRKLIGVKVKYSAISLLIYILF